MKKLLLLTSFVISLKSFSQSNAISFDGSNDYLEVTDNNVLDLSDNFTLEAWIYPTGTGSQPTEGGIILNKEASYEIARFADGTIRFALSANGAGNDWNWVNTGLVAPLNQWSHIAMVKNGTTVVVYLNGVSPNTTVSQPATLTANSNNLRIGGRIITSHNFAGYIDEIRIWNTACTQTTIKTYLFDKSLSLSASGLVAYYRMNSGSGSTALNSCANTSGIDAILTNGPVWVTSPIQFSSNAISFDGTDDYVTIADNNTLDITSAITIEAWVYATKNSGIQNVISKSNNINNDGYIFPRTDNGWANVRFYLNIGGWQILTATYPSLNAWHHLAATYDGSTMKLYIDGTLAASRAQTGSISTNTNALILGNQPGWSENFGGYGDEFRIWNVARTEAEIQANMNVELDPSTQTGLVSYYNSNQGSASGTNTGVVSLLDQKGSNIGTLVNFSLSGSTSNFIAQNTSLTLLQTSLINFTAKPYGNKIVLNWSMSDETTTMYYEIERSKNGMNWKSIGTVAAVRNTALLHSYSFTDAVPLNGINQYRVVQKDKDGKKVYSKTQSCEVINTHVGFKIYPNPVVEGNVTVYLKHPGKVTLYNAVGIVVLMQEMKAGTSLLHLQNLPAGTYYIGTGIEKIVMAIQ